MPSVHPVAPARNTAAVTEPGWVELAVAVLAALVLYMIGSVLAARIPDDATVSPGQVNFLISGLAPLGAFTLAVLVRIRDVRPFGLRTVSPGWLVAGLAAGILCFGLSWPISAVFDPFFLDSQDVQDSYRDAATSGLRSLAVTVMLGGTLTPIGEEFLFRGALAHFLYRWGPWTAITVSAAVFAVAHGIKSVMPLAFVIGIATGLLLRSSGSIWPAVAVHMAYNSAGMIYHGTI
ncbi:CPBP family intramembrane glutamic endopeptidase [Streptomyces halstedii]|uniref:CPBP family intramembrane metalloprotease n=1 Tax=Streptomyces halstedii TaxID=1944 RepID=A0A6N9UAF3_STRHA|nr:type II CAAX endopeptidase family protein [Streptomyces halstedii]NEA19053.1 CPBP family intramembrane metalloprotease [Streptomyces halstedii]